MWPSSSIVDQMIQFHSSRADDCQPGAQSCTTYFSPCSISDDDILHLHSYSCYRTYIRANPSPDCSPALDRPIARRYASSRAAKHQPSGRRRKFRPMHSCRTDSNIPHESHVRPTPAGALIFPWADGTSASPSRTLHPGGPSMARATNSTSPDNRQDRNQDVVVWGSLAIDARALGQDHEGPDHRCTDTPKDTNC